MRHEACVLMIIVLLIWSLRELMNSPPYILGAEAPDRMDALVNDLA